MTLLARSIPVDFKRDLFVAWSIPIDQTQRSRRPGHFGRTGRTPRRFKRNRARKGKS